MLHTFLLTHEAAILALTEAKTRELALALPSSARLEGGLGIFYRQMVAIVAKQTNPAHPPEKDISAIAVAAQRLDEPAMALAAGRPAEAEVAVAAGRHGAELFRLGYTLSHVVHAYGAMCQSITELASAEATEIDASEFHALNRCLDVAIAGAVTAYQSLQDSIPVSDGWSNAAVVARQMKTELTFMSVAFESIQSGRVGVGGSTGQVVVKSMERLHALVDGLAATGVPTKAA